MIAYHAKRRPRQQARSQVPIIAPCFARIGWQRTGRWQPCADAAAASSAQAATPTDQYDDFVTNGSVVIAGNGTILAAGVVDFRESSMFDPQRLLGQLVGQALGVGVGGRSRRRSAIGAGGLGSKAALGLGALGIAMAAFEHYQQRTTASGAMAGSAAPASTPGNSVPPPPPPAATAGAPPPPPAATAQSAADARLLVQCMIAAAAADGSIDGDERARILERMRGLGLDDAGEAFLSNELAAPKSADEIGATTRPGLAEAVYAAALLGIDPDHPAESAFLDRLAGALGLSAATRQTLSAQLSGPTGQP